MVGFKPKEEAPFGDESMLFSDLPKDNDSWLNIPVMQPDNRASVINPGHKTFYIDDNMSIDKLLELEESKIL